MDTQTLPNNVIDIRTGDKVLPAKIRSILKGQFVESKEMDHNPEAFIHLLEERLLSEAARAIINTTKDFFEDTFSGVK